MSGFLQFMGAVFITFLLLAPLVGVGIYHKGKAAGIKWATEQVYGSTPVEE